MLKRRMYQKLVAWKDDPKRKVLILLGARQTGKTYLVRQFANENYPDYIEVNFLEDEEGGLFLSGAKSAEELLSRLSLIIGRSIPDNCMVFFDEVQEAKEIVTLSKFLLDDGRFDLVLSGSLLGTALAGVSSFPVGYARIERMYPLCFEEFCWAVGVPQTIIDEVFNCYQNKTALETSLHERLTTLYRQYIVVGGMPEAVQKFVDGRRDLGAARETDAAIIEQYRYDIAKYVPDARRLQIQTIFDNIPAQLDKENKRFMMMSTGKGASYDRLKDDFSWLVQAGVALPTLLVREPRLPLMRTRVKEKFKLYSSDCGILLAQYPDVMARKIIAGDKDVNYGAIYENAIAQEIQCAGLRLYYYHHSAKGEVDFLIETHEGDVIPIKVKSGKNYKVHVALNNLLKTQEHGINCAYVLSEANVDIKTREGKPIYYLPLYMSMCIRTERGDGLAGEVLEEVSFEDWQ